MSASTEFVTSLPFLGYKQRNAVLDSFFYDTASLTVEEKTKLSPLVDREGSIIVVPPSNSDRQIRHYKRALRFMNKEGPTIRAIAVAGVGSSVLGTAAVARNIADALDTDVAGIITGYGLSDVMTEAFGGWFVFSAADRIRYATEKFLERMRAVTPADRVPGDNDVATLAEILLAGPPALEYLVTHSKGSLVASHALRQYVDDLEGDDSPLFERLHITTLGAVVGLPTAFKNVKQYLGTLDWFGRVNSSPGVTHERIPGASHHLNPGFPYHMSVAALLNGGNGGVAPRLLPKPALEVMFAPFSVPVVEVPEPAPTAAAVKAKEQARKPEKKMAPKVAPAAPPKVTSASPKVAGPAPKAASSAAKGAGAAPKVASPGPKVAGGAAKLQAVAVKAPSVASKPAVKPVPKKATEPVRISKPKTISANGKFTAKKSKK